VPPFDLMKQEHFRIWIPRCDGLRFRQDFLVRAARVAERVVVEIVTVAMDDEHEGVSGWGRGKPGFVMRRRHRAA
jgi:hypothetical protein